MTAAELDALLGDPHDADNPTGYAAVLAADEHQEMLAAGERLLDRYGLNAEFVPVAYGGRLARADVLAEIMRTLWRRDPSLGLGYGLSSLIAAVNVWTAGDERQRRQAATLLLGNGRIAAAFHELAHGNDFAHAECSADAATGPTTGPAAGPTTGPATSPTTGGWLLSGRKEIVTNLRRAEAMVLFARTSQTAGSRGHSQFLIARDELPAHQIRDLPRFPSSGMRGVHLGGVEFTRCPVPGRALIGQPGQGMEVALRSYQVTRALMPAIFVGPLDTALRLALSCAIDRRLYGGAVADLPFVRAVIARAYADLLAIDAFASVAVRGLHLVPGSMAVYAPAAKHLTSRILLGAFEDLRSVLGAQSYLRQGPYAMFQKLARDVAPATFAHVSRAACAVLILPQLPRLARRSWGVDPPAPAALFDLGADLPPLCLDHLVTGMPRRDGLAGVLAGEPLPDLDGPAARFATRFRQELRALGDACAALAPADITIDASPEAFALVDRYTTLLAAASALGVWRAAGGRYSGLTLLGVLDQLARRLGGPPVLSSTESDSVRRHLFDEAAARFRDHRLFDLTARVVPG